LYIFQFVVLKYNSKELVTMTANRSIILGDILYLNPKMCLSFHSRNERLSNKSEKEFLNNIVRFFLEHCHLECCCCCCGSQQHLWHAMGTKRMKEEKDWKIRKRMKDQCDICLIVFLFPHTCVQSNNVSGLVPKPF